MRKNYFAQKWPKNQFQKYLGSQICQKIGKMIQNSAKIELNFGQKKIDKRPNFGSILLLKIAQKSIQNIWMDNWGKWFKFSQNRAEFWIKKAQNRRKIWREFRFKTASKIGKKQNCLIFSTNGLKLASILVLKRPKTQSKIFVLQICQKNGQN